jgi:diguanylate cyclase (GGDEF)-like protein/PAS domain S-box-containing protein
VDYPGIVLTRGLLALALLPVSMIALAHGEEPSFKSDSVVLQLKGRHQFQFAGYYAAKEKGFYHQAGLNVVIHEGLGGQSPIDRMLRGEADYVVSSSEVVLHRAQGHPVVALAAIYQHCPYALLVKADSGIKAVSDLIGRRVMLGIGTQDAALHAMLKRAGLKDSDYHRLLTRADVETLIQDEVDAFNAYLTNQGFLLKERGIEPYFIRPKDYGIDFYGDVLVTTEQEIEQHPQRVERFLKATLDGWSYALKHVDEMVDLISEKYNPQGISREHLLYEANLSKELIQPLLIEIGYMNAERWAHIHSVFVELGLLESNSQINGMIYQSAKPVPMWLQWALRHYFLLLGGVLSFLILLLVRINIHMRRQVAARTKELARQERKYKTIFNAAPEGMWVVDSDYKTVEVNRCMFNLLGYHREEMLGKTPMAFTNFENRKVFEEQTRKVKTAGRSKYDISLRHKDGHMFSTHFSMIALRGEGQGVAASIAFVQDISEQKRLEAQLRTGEQNLRRLINAQPACVSTFDQHGHLLSINSKGLEIFQADSLSEIKDKFINNLVDEPYQKDFIQLNRSVFKGHSGYITFSATGRLGRQLWLEMHSVPIIDTKEQVVEHLGLTHDVTSRLRMEMELLEEREFLQVVIDNIRDSVMVVDTDLRILLMNSTFKTMLRSLDLNMTTIKSYFDLPYVKGLRREKQLSNCPVLEAMKKASQVSAVVKKPFISNSSGRGWMEVIASPILNQDGTLRGVIEISRDITEHLELLDEVKQQKDDLQYLAHHDSLTNLPNRALFLLRLKQAVSKAKRAAQQMAVLFIDLDRFKEINDTLGHAMGDQVLNEVARRFQKSIRTEDLLARLGGDEFTLISEELNNPHHAGVVAKHIIQTLGAPFEIANHQFYMTASIGISIYPQDGMTAEMLLRNADAAMYKAKDEGKNTFQFYTEDMTEQAFERIYLETNLRQALEARQLVVHYQPQVNMASGQIVGVEALVRWLNPKVGLIEPSRFIPLAEETGLIIPLGEQVIRIACEQMIKWEQKGIRPRFVAINLSVKQIGNRKLISVLRNILSETHCQPEWLEFEVTEGSLMKNPDKSGTILQRLRSLGFELAIDDFGTGYSSLAYLKRFPLTRLKIDQSFIRDVPKDPDDIAITRAIIALAKSLNLRVIAEGVESEVQKTFLMDEGCYEAQGFYYGQPYAEAEMTQMLEQNLAEL